MAERTIANLAGILSSLVDRTAIRRIIIAGDFNHMYGKVHEIAAQWGLIAALERGTQTHSGGGALDQVFTNLEILNTKLGTPATETTDHRWLLL